MHVKGFFVLASLAVGCGGGLFQLDNGNGGGAGTGGGMGPPAVGSVQAALYFDMNVAPIFEAKCAACHMGTGPSPIGAPPFLGPSRSTFYASVKSDPRKYTTTAPDTSLLLTKGAHEGPALAPAEAAAIRTWLTMEGAGGGEAA